MKTKQSFLLKRHFVTHVPVFYAGWSEEDFRNEYMKIATHNSTLTKSQREFVINIIKKYDTKGKNNKTLDGINK